MSYAKYLSSSLCGFGEEDFLSFHYMYIRKTNDPTLPPPGGANFDPRAKTTFVEVH